MPKVRKSLAQAAEFEVSPWQTKKRKYDDADQLLEKPVARLGSDELPQLSLVKVPNLVCNYVCSIVTLFTISPVISMRGVTVQRSAYSPSTHAAQTFVLLTYLTL